MSASARTRRLFVAAELDEETRTRCAAAARSLRDGGYVARWVTPENYHLTLAFIGVADEARVDDVALAVRKATDELSAFDVELDAIGAFPSGEKPRVLWAGPARPVPAFVHACVAVRRALEGLGFTFEPHTDAHVTLARADGKSPLPSGGMPATAMRVAALTLFESRAGAAGVRYEPLEHFGLR